MNYLFGICLEQIEIYIIIQTVHNTQYVNVWKSKVLHAMIKYTQNMRFSHKSRVFKELGDENKHICLALRPEERTI